jgi:integrase
MACIRKRNLIDKAGKPYMRYVVDYKDHKGVRRTPQFEKKKEAEIYLDKVKRELFEGSHVAVSETMNFDELAKAYLRECERRHHIGDEMTGNTVVNTRWAVEKHLIPHFGSAKASLISGADVQAFINTKAEKYRRVSVCRMLEHLRMLMRFGVRIGKLRRNIVVDDPPRMFREEKQRLQLPSLSALQAMVVAIETAIESPEFRLPGQRRQKNDGLYISALVTYLAMTAGYRTGEICALSWEDIDLVENTLSITKSWSRYDGLKGTKSEAGKRVVPIAPLLRKHLIAAWERQGRPSSGLVIRTQSGRHVPPRELSPTYWRPIARSLNVTREDARLLNLHGLRHVAASLWIKGGVPDLALKQLIGHSSVAFTKDVYGHLFPDDLSARAAMASAMAAVMPADRPLLQHSPAT